VRLAGSSILAVAIACAPARPSTTTSARDDSKSAAALLHAVVARYETARTYQDTGRSTEVLRPDDDTHVQRSNISFQTAFERSGGFLFDYTQTPEAFFPPTRGVVWRQSEGPARVWWTQGPPVEEKTIEMAIAGFTGVSGATAYNVPAMLFGLGSPWDERLPFRIEGEETVGGVVCQRVGGHTDDRTVTFWIGKRDHSLRRIFDRQHLVPERRSSAEILADLPPDASEELRKAAIDAHDRVGPFVAESTIDYAPSFDGPVAAKRFDFTPPSATADESPPRDFCVDRDVKAAGKEPLIDDLEDGDGLIRVADARHGEWYVTGDPGCRLAPKVVEPKKPPGKNASRFAMHVGAESCTSWGFQMGLLLNHEGVACAYDARVYDGVYFWARSAGGELTVTFAVATRQTLPRNYGGDGTCESVPDACWDHYRKEFLLTPEWRRYSVTWRDLAQSGWGKAAEFDVAKLGTLLWGAKGQPAFAEFWVDQIGFFAGSPPARKP
jgi:hypothetical protein